MFLALAALLIHSHVAPKVSFPAVKAALDARAEVSALSADAAAEKSLPDAELVSAAPTSQPAVEPSAELPAAPVPAAVVNSPAPVAFIKPSKPAKVSVGELYAENRRRQLEWRGLAIAASSAAEFDAWSTNRAISTTGAVELNPMLKPFAGNSSMYVAIQAGPVLMDLLGKKMMTSRYSWVRRMWWLPQSASFAGSMFCGSHNVAFH